MPIQPYDPCPGGRNKKVKFCCPDLLADLDALDRAARGGQPRSAVEMAERLSARYPGRPCLLNYLARLAIQQEDFIKAEAAVGELLKADPANPNGLAIKVRLFLDREGDPQLAIDWLQTAFESAESLMPTEVVGALSGLVTALLRSDHRLASAAHNRLLLQLVAPIDRDLASETHAEFMGMAKGYSIELDYAWIPQKALPGSPGQAEIDSAVEKASRGRWRTAAAELEAMAGRFGANPSLWLNLGILRGYLADNARAVEALRRYSRMPVPQESAVDAEALALTLSGEPLLEHAGRVTLKWPLLDADAAVSRLRSDRSFLASDQTPDIGEVESVAPAAIGLLLDRAENDDEEAPESIDVCPVILGTVMAFGKETDREARLYLQVRERFESVAVARMSEILGLDLSRPERKVEPELSLHPTAIEPLLIVRHGDRGPVGERLRNAQVARACAERLPAERWPALGGRTFSEAAADAAGQIRAMALIRLLMLTWDDPEIDESAIRVKAGLPKLRLTEPESLNDTDSSAMVLLRVDLERATNHQLEAWWISLRRSGNPLSTYRLAREIVTRGGGAPVQLRISVLAFLASGIYRPSETMHWVEEGRKLCHTAGNSSLIFDVSELRYQAFGGEPERVHALFAEIARSSQRDPGVLNEAMTIMIQSRHATLVAESTPDGEQRLRFVMRPPAEPAQTIWTPDQGASTGSGKIWTPGMD
jgi:hypothetical protein